MSIKIYNGWKLNVSSKELYPLLWDIKKRSIEIIKSNLRDIYYSQPIKTSISNHAFEVEKQLSKNIMKESSNMVRSPFDPECNLCIYPYKNQFYARSFCDNVSLIVKNSLDFLKGMNKVEEFYYFNNSDQPKEITNKEWTNRKKVWDNILNAETDYVGNFIILEICSISVMLNAPPYSYFDFIAENKEKLEKK